MVVRLPIGPFPVPDPEEAVQNTTPHAPKNRHRQTKKRVIIALNLAVLLVLGTGATAYGVLAKKVTLDVDGQTETVRTFGGSVSSLLAAQDVEPAADDQVSHDPTSDVADGETIKVRTAKDVTVAVDGEVQDATVHAATVDEALEALDVEPAEGAEMSADPETLLEGDEQIVVSNPKELVVVADGEKKKITSAAPTAGEVVEEAGVELGSGDRIDVGRNTLVKNDDVLKVVRVEMIDTTEKVTKDAPVEYRDDDSLERGTEKVLQEGRPEVIEQRLLITERNGKESHRLVLAQKTLEEAQTRVIARGTAEPEPEPVASDAPSVADGSVWDRLAQCESGGNWSINTGNGYYGGLQFTASTWASVGGSGLPHENSREEQIKRGKILQQRSGWGQWPSCTAKLGLR